MAELSTQFRASLHGYNREDVVDYIDRMNQEHEDTVQRLQKSIAKLREELAEAGNGAVFSGGDKAPDQALSDAHAQIADLRHLNYDLEDRIQKLEEQLEQARKEHVEGEAIPPVVQNEDLERLQAENAQLRAKLEAAEEAVAEATEHSDAEKELSDAQFLIGELRSNEDAQKAKIESLESELSQIRGAWKSELDSVMQDHEAAMEALRKENAEIREELNTANEALAAAQENSEAESRLLETKLQVEELLIRNERLEEQNESQRQELEKAVQSNRDLQSRVQELKAELEKARNARVELMSKNQAHETAIEAMRVENAAIRAELSTANDCLAYVMDNGEGEGKLMESKLQLDGMHIRNGDLEKRVVNLQEELATATAENKALNNQILDLQLELDNLREAATEESELEQLSSADSDQNYAEMELAAYRRAEQTERMARKRAEQMERQARERVEQLERQAQAQAEHNERVVRDQATAVQKQLHSVFGQANENITSAHTDLEQLCQEMTENVNQMLRVLEKVNGAYRQTEESFAELGAQNGQLVEVTN